MCSLPAIGLRCPTRMRSFRSFVVWIVLVVLGGAAALAAAQSRDALRSFLSSPSLRGARVGLLVADLETGEPVAGHEVDRALVPASNQKLLVASAALAHWGPTHRFETPVYRDGRLSGDGVLEGALWIEGRGDPGLVSERMWKLAEEIRLHGVREVRGALGIDATYFDEVAMHPDWGPASSRAYQAPISAFAANYSAFRVDVSGSASAGRPVRVDVAPAIPYLRTRAEAKTIARTHQLFLDVRRLPDGSGEYVRVSGAFPLGLARQTYWRSVSMPTRYAASVLRAQLEAQGVRVTGGTIVGPRPPSAVELLRFEGGSVSEHVRLLNKHSNNFVAEQLTKMLGAERYGAPGTWEKGARALVDHLAELGLSDPSTIVRDGSGLSVRNRLSPRILIGILRAAGQRFDTGAEFLASLPLAGLDGTLSDRMVQSEVVVRAKTGHLHRVASLSGVVSDASGRRLAFAVLVNGANGGARAVDRAIDDFVSGLGRISASVADSAAVGGSHPVGVSSATGSAEREIDGLHHHQVVGGGPGR